MIQQMMAQRRVNNRNRVQKKPVIDDSDVESDEDDSDDDLYGRDDKSI